MKTLLIVEDEKKTRQEIKSMIQRSGVSVDMILECSNASDAINLLSTRHVDVMFTEIKLKKMDGLELVRRVNKMEDKPLIVVISGCDDFTYAVEMLRNGVKDYLLKPVERERITSVLHLLNNELEKINDEKYKEKMLGLRQLKELIDSRDLKDADRRLIISKYEPYFFDVEYRICIYNEEPLTDYYGGILLPGRDDGCAIILKAKYVNAFIMDEMYEKCAGVGGLHTGLAQLTKAYEEAADMRKLSFIMGKTCIYEEDKPISVNPKLMEKGKELLSDSERTARLQVIGTDKTDDVISRWKTFFRALENGQLELVEFADEMQRCIAQIPDIYREHVTDTDVTMVETFKSLHNFESLADYQMSFMDWLLDLNKRLGDRPDDSNIRQKIMLAKEYIKDNYDKDLNMAVVSNYVSMNYSLFSYSFKQYAGSNFVNYLKQMRIEKAKELLADSDLKIIEISQRVGYDNEKHFMKIFKSMCGVSPGEYRKNMTS